MTMFERFTKRARRSLVVAQEAARDLGPGRIGTEHLLLGLLAEPEGVAGQVLLRHGLTLETVWEEVRRQVAAPTDEEALRTIGIDLDEVRAAVEGSFGPGALDRLRQKRRPKGDRTPPFSPEAKKVLELALREALALDHSYLGTEHLLLGILRGADPAAMAILTGPGGDPAALRAEVLDAIPPKAS
jgi:ATP-dependent Clp protease ATP-binding subunit ClpA